MAQWNVTRLCFWLAIAAACFPAGAYAAHHSHHKSEKAKHHHSNEVAETSSDTHRHHHKQHPVELSLRERKAIWREHEANVAAEQRHAWQVHLQRVAEQEAEHRERVAEMIQEQLASSTMHPTQSITAWSDYVLNVPVKVITVDLNDPEVKVRMVLARNGIGSAEPFSDMIARVRPTVAVTGTYFSLDDNLPVGDIVVDGNLKYFGGMGTALAITSDNHADMVTMQCNHHHDWSSYNFVVSCGPRLLEDSQIVLDPAAEGFHDNELKVPNSRIGVGILPNNKLMFVMTTAPIYLGRLAKVMKTLGCVQAMNLDAGTSTGFYCDGMMIARPGRHLTNAIVVYGSEYACRKAMPNGGVEQADL